MLFLLLFSNVQEKYSQNLLFFFSISKFILIGVSDLCVNTLAYVFFSLSFSCIYPRIEINRFFAHRKRILIKYTHTHTPHKYIEIYPYNTKDKH